MEAEAVDGRLKEAEAKEKLTAVPSLVVVIINFKTKLDGQKDEPGSFYNLFLMLETDYD